MGEVGKGGEAGSLPTNTPSFSPEVEGERKTKWRRRERERVRVRERERQRVSERETERERREGGRGGSLYVFGVTIYLIDHFKTC